MEAYLECPFNTQILCIMFSCNYKNGNLQGNPYLFLLLIFVTWTISAGQTLNIRNKIIIESLFLTFCDTIVTSTRICITQLRNINIEEKIEQGKCYQTTV